MAATIQNSIANLRKLEWDRTKAFIILSVTNWISHYLLFRKLGLYEDDYSFFGWVLNWNLSDLIAETEVFLTWPLGRPIGTFLPRFLGFLGDQIGGLTGMYLLAFTILTVNSFLFYLLLRQVSSEELALLGGLAFSLFPADTTKSFLTHAFQLQTSLMFMLIASHAYLRERKLLAYGFILSTLLTYETPFVLFFGIPLLQVKEKWDKVLIRKLIRNAFILIVMIACVFAIRFFVTTDSRIGLATDLRTVLFQIFAGLIIGPSVSLVTFLYVPALTVRHYLDLNTAAIISISFITFLGFLVTIKGIPGNTWMNYLYQFRHKFRINNRESAISEEWFPIVKLALVGIILLVLGYGLSFTHFPPTRVFGRGTSVHLAATIGASILFACAGIAFLSMKQSKVFGRFVIPLMALYLSLLIGYHFAIQLNFQKSWQYQQWFWTNVIESTPDLTDGTMVFVIGDRLPDTDFIYTNYWMDAFMFENLYYLPDEWRLPPRLVVEGNMPLDERVKKKNGQFFVSWFGDLWQFPMQPSNVIILRYLDGQLVRSQEVIEVAGELIQPKPIGPATTLAFKRAELFSYLIQKNSR